MIEPRRALVAALLVASLLATTAASAPSRPATVLGAGDVASCPSEGDEATAALVRARPGTVAVLGDAVYDRGSVEEFHDCYGPSWGLFRGRTRAALGNHEYGTGNADAAIAYFRLPQNGWYSYELGSWHVVVLNSNCAKVGGCGPGSPQWRWLRNDLRLHRPDCALAYWHHARWSSGLHGSDETMAHLWRLLAVARADVVLAGHDHHYERFAPIDGIRSFVVGTGGKSHYPVVRARPYSRVVNWTTFGVLGLTLRDGGYDWRFLPEAGKAFTDAGSARCR